MKVLIISDIHDDFDSLKKAITNHPKIDHLVLLGDLGYYNEQVFNLLNLFKDIIISVKGNNDFFNDSIKFKNDDYYQTISIDNKTWFITHGHMYNEYNLPKVDFDIYLKRRQSEFVNDEEAFNMLNEEVLKSGDKANQKLISKKMVIDKNLNASKAKLTSAISLTANHPEGMIIAAVFVVKANKTATIMIDSFDKNFSTFNGKHLIIWKLIEKFSKEGYHLFNLGGIANKVDVGNKYYGLNNYKLGFGAKAYEYIGDLELVTNKPLYLMYNNSVNLFKKKK